MPTAPSQVSGGLATITAQAVADIQTVAAASESPTEIRAALFAATPLIVSDFGDGAAELALEWYEQLRDAASPRRMFIPRPVVTVREDHLATTVAWATQALHDLEQQSEQVLRTIETELEQQLADAVDEAMSRLLPEIQKEVAAGFRDTITENAARDPDAAGWKRHALADACKLCVMLAARGAVYTEATAGFAAHTSCNCIAGPEFGGKDQWAEATPMQYVASQRTRTAKERADLRKYLNRQFPDAPG